MVLPLSINFECALSSVEAETRRTPWGLYLSLLTPSGRAGFPLELHGTHQIVTTLYPF